MVSTRQTSSLTRVNLMHADAFRSSTRRSSTGARGGDRRRERRDGRRSGGTPHGREGLPGLPAARGGYAGTRVEVLHAKEEGDRVSTCANPTRIPAKGAPPGLNA